MNSRGGPLRLRLQLPLPYKAGPGGAGGVAVAAPAPPGPGQLLGPATQRSATQRNAAAAESRNAHSRPWANQVSHPDRPPGSGDGTWTLAVTLPHLGHDPLGDPGRFPSVSLQCGTSGCGMESLAKRSEEQLSCFWFQPRAGGSGKNTS